MKKRNYKKIEAGPNGWSNWQSPIHGHGKRNYRFACCDCGLVHEMQFRIKIGRYVDSVVFRVTRNNKATAAMRRGKRYVKNH